MNKEGTEVVVLELPKCQLPHTGEVPDAVYDGKPNQGPWGYMCQRHFQVYGVGLGVGKGQRLVLKKEEEKPSPLSIGAVLKHKERLP